MKKNRSVLILLITFVCVLFSIQSYANSLEPYIVLEAEDGDLTGDHFKIQSDQGGGYVLAESNLQGNENLISMTLNLVYEDNYEFWIRVSGNGSGRFSLVDSNSILVENSFTVNDSKWKWIKFSQTKSLTPDRYYVVLSGFSGNIKIDNFVVKTPTSVGDMNDTDDLSGSVLPGLPDTGAWINNSLNSFASLIHNGDENVSIASGILNISVIDLRVPGRNGLDLVISRYYNSKSFSRKVSEEGFDQFEWNFGFPRIVGDNVYFPNGSICNFKDESVEKSTQDVGKDKKRIYVNHKVQYFKLIQYDQFSHWFLGNHYDLRDYEMHLVDGTVYRFNKDGKITSITDKNSNSISFTYQSDRTIITDTVGRIYHIIDNGSQMDVVRQADQKTLVSYNYADDFVVTDALGRKTTYKYGISGITEIIYPSGKTSRYQHGSKNFPKSDTRKYSYDVYWVESQAIYDVQDDQESLVKKTEFKYNFADVSRRKIKYIYTEEYNEDQKLMSTTYYHKNKDDLVVRTKTINEEKRECIRTVYTDYNDNHQRTKESVYYGNIYEVSYDLFINHDALAINKKDKSPELLLKEEQWEYDRRGNLIYYKDPEGYETLTTYVNSDSTPFNKIDSSLQITPTFYNNSALAGKEIYNLPAGQIQIRSYSSSDNYKAAETYYLYNGDGNLIESKVLNKNQYGNMRWIKTQYLDYDEYGNCQRKVLNAGSAHSITINYEYGSENNHAYLTKQTQRISTNLVDDAGNNATAVDATVEYTYDFLTGNQKKVINHRDRELEYKYDVLGRVTRVIYPKTESESSPTYEELVYGDQKKWASYGYFNDVSDEEKNSVEVYDGERHKVIHYFDSLGRSTKIEKYEIKLVSDGKVESAEYVLHSSVTKSYSWQNQVSMTVDENGIETHYTYDLLGRKKEVSTLENGVKTVLYTFDYDDVNHTATFTDQIGRVQTTITDKKGQIAETRVENKGIELISTSEYDGIGNVIKTVDAKGQEMGYIYNNLGQLVQTRYPDLSGQVYEGSAPDNQYTVFNHYDAFGKLEQVVDRNGHTITYGYNEYNQPTKIDLPDSEDLNYYYNELGQLIKVVQNGKFKKLFSYDARSRVTSETFTDLQMNQTYTTAYDYEKNNQVAGITYPKQAGKLAYNYNTVNQINKVTWNGSPLVKEVRYLKNGYLSEVSYDNNVTGEFGYDYINGQYVPDNIGYRQGNKNIGIYDYHYDLLGNIIRSNNHQYEYDDLNQLEGWKFIKENDQVLIGEEVIWDKSVAQSALTKSNTIISNDAMQLAIELNQGVIGVKRLSTSEVVSSSNVVFDSNQGSLLKRNYETFTETFSYTSKIDYAKTTAKVDTTNDLVTIPKQWNTVFEEYIDSGIDVPNAKSADSMMLSWPGSNTYELYYTKMISLSKGVNYKLDADSVSSKVAKIKYELKGPSGTQTITKNSVFTVPVSGSYTLSVSYYLTEDYNGHENLSIVRRVRICKEGTYLQSAVLQLRSYTLDQSCKKITVEYNHSLPTGTSIEYLVSNDGGITWRKPTYSSSLKTYVASFSSSGNKIVFRANLNANSQKTYVPSLSRVKITALDSGKHVASGTLLTKSMGVSVPSVKMVLELNGQKNNGSIKVTLQAKGQSIVGVPTTVAEIVQTDLYDNNEYNKYSTNNDDIDYSGLISRANTLRTEVSIKNLQAYYYRFDLPAEWLSTTFDAQLKIELGSGNNGDTTPNVHSFILLNNPQTYYSTGTFSVQEDLTTQKNSFFDKIKLEVIGQNPASTSSSYEVYDFDSVQSKVVKPGEVTSLGTDIESFRIRGRLSTTNPYVTPKVTAMKVTAIGETPLRNDLESVSDVSTTSTSSLSTSTDCVVGNYSIRINSNIANYKLNHNQEFDATNLPIIQLWVKPLTSSPIRFSSLDVTEGRYEYLLNSTGSTDFEVGKDLKLNKWNLVLLDLRNTTGGGIKKNARGLVIYAISDFNYLIDGLSSLPANEAEFVYDNVGNRTQYKENDIVTNYTYEMGSNRLMRRFSTLDDRIVEDVTYDYDRNGNMIYQRVDSNGIVYWFDYTYNELNQLVEVKRNGFTIARYYYDHAGLRYKKVEPLVNKTIIYIYSTGTEPIYEEVYENGSLVSKVSYLFMGGKRIARVEGGKLSYYFADHLGSTRIVMDSAGKCTYNEYTPFGADFGGATGERYKFTGKEDDGATGLQYFNARYYDPAVGRFVSEDPVKDGVNWYVYCKSNPLKYYDPDGLNATGAVLGCSWVTLFDGPLPIIDAVYSLTLAGTTLVEYGPLLVEALFADDDSNDGDNSLEEDKPIPDIKYPGDDPTVSPGEDWEWRGKGDPRSGKGSWYNPKTGESLHPDLQHPEPIGPHWDYKASDGTQYRVNPDGSIVPK